MSILKHKHHALSLALGLLLACACNDRNWIGAGSDFISTNSRLVYIDNLSVELSTYRDDSISTSGTGTALVGYYTDPHIGQIEASAFISMGNNSQRITGEIITIDSIKLELYHADFFYGDSLRSTKLNIYRVTEEIEPRTDEKDIYNTRKFAFDPTPLASTSYTLYPHSKKAIVVDLPMDFANELLGYLTLPVRPEVEEYGLHRYFKGIHIAADPSASGAVMGYLLNDTSCCIKMYYHTNTNSEIVSVHKISANSYNASNYIATDANNPMLKQLRSTPVITDSTQHTSIMLNQLGIYTRVDFPTLKDFFVDNRNMQIARAELQICPTANAQTEHRPQSVYLYYADANNTALSAVLNGSTGSAEVCSYKHDPIFFHRSYYSWDITQYVRNIVNTADVENYGLQLISDDSPNSFHPMLLSSPRYADSETKLILYLLNHE